MPLHGMLYHCIKAVPGILPTLLDMVCFFAPTIDMEPEERIFIGIRLNDCLSFSIRAGQTIMHCLFLQT